MNKQYVNKKIEPNSDNLTFVEYCDGLKNVEKEPREVHTPLDNFFIVLAAETGKHAGSVRRWFYGTAKPGELEKRATAKLLKSDVEILFPSEPC